MPKDLEIIVPFIIALIALITLMYFMSATLMLHSNRQNAHQRVLDNLKNQFSQELLKAQLEIEQQILTEISREIHDDIGSSLSLAKLGLNTISLPEDTPAKGTIKEAVELLSSAINNLRNLSQGMNFEAIKTKGFEDAIKKIIERIKITNKYLINYTVTGTYNIFEEQKEIILYRIFQEAINNIIRHADASTINVALVFTDSEIVLSISDDGKGFKPSSLEREGGIGNIKKRAELISAELKIASRLGSGSQLFIRVPIQKVNP